tara:strand:+ start:11325 stop:12122 length:798 start_codon:yes stop_codon:yes gene_type:complete
MKKGKILFTGGNGFIGHQLVPLLRNDGWEVVSPLSSEIRLECENEVDTLFESNSYRAIIHAAMIGKKFGGRNVIDDKSIVYTNMMMVENLFKHVDKIDLFINFDSGVSSGPIPSDPYGFSKYCIAQRFLNHIKGINLRVWGCFGPYEDPKRFFHTNINNYLQKKDITIHKDIKMDFIYADDLYKIVKYFLHFGDRSHTKEVNCVYEKKYLLSEIAEIINNLDDYKVNITMEEEYSDNSYCGDSNDLGIDYIGLEKGIRECWSAWK